MAMKTTHRVRHKKQAWSESNRDCYKKLNRRTSSEELKADSSEFSIQRIGRPNTITPSVPRFGPKSTIGVFRPVGKRANYTSEILTRSSPLMTKVTPKHSPRGTSSIAITKSFLPPIKGSRMTPGEVACSITHASRNLPVKLEEPKAKLKARILSSNLNKENALFRLYLSQQNEDLIRGSLTVRTLKDSVKNLTSRAHAFGRSASANEKLKEQPTQASSSAPLNLPVQRQEPVEENIGANKCNETTHLTDGAAGSSEPKQTKQLCSDASCIDTDSQCTEGQDGSEVISEDPCLPEEYYTHQKITEWVLKVNANLFSPSSESIRSITPCEEQDTAIKIVYEGD